MRTLTPEIAPMVYVMMFVSVMIGFFFATGFFMSHGAESILYGTGVLIDKEVWGGFLFCTATTAFVGMIIHNDWMIQLGGISGFMAWSFACISLALASHWYLLLTLGLMHLLFHGYVYLATALGIIYRIPHRR